MDQRYKCKSKIIKVLEENIDKSLYKLGGISSL